MIEFVSKDGFTFHVNLARITAIAEKPKGQWFISFGSSADQQVEITESEALDILSQFAKLSLPVTVRGM